MNIALITYPIETNPAGIGVYAQHIARNLTEIDDRNSYHLLHFTPSSNPLYARNEILYRRHKWLPVMFSDSVYLRSNSSRFDIVHRFSPGGFIFKTDAKIVITVHDLFLYKRYPFNRHTRNVLANFSIRSSLRKAHAIVADSDFTRREILEAFEFAKNKVHVVHCAPGIVPTDGERASRALANAYGVDHEYILFVSTIEPRKNLIALVKAFEIMKERHHIVEDLVIVGKEGWDSRKTLKYIGASRYRDAIRMLGFVPKADLPSFYQKARLFVYPSLMEGFGIPPLEAMACGCPTLTSNTSSLPEVVGNEEMMFDPTNVEEIVEKALRILKDKTCREENIGKGMENVKRFDWGASARQIIRIYNSL